MKRRKSRELTLQALYQYDVSKISLDELIKFNWLDQNISFDILSYATDLTSGTINNIDKIDNTILENVEKKEDFLNLKPVDKAILRFSVYSLKYQKDVPQSVVINEAVEISKRYGDENIFKYINKILDLIKEKEEEK